jgi:hypothetical protein
LFVIKVPYVYYMENKFTSGIEISDQKG